MLAIDVGNTRTKFGLFSISVTSTGPAVELPTCEKFLAVPHGEAIPWKTLTGWTHECHPHVLLAGSNPERLGKLTAGLRDHGWTDLQSVADRSLIPLTIDVDTPEKVGIDRLLNAVAANVLRPANRPAIVIDTGTAATVDFLAADGRFCGGGVLPGGAWSAQGLHHFPAPLPFLPGPDLANDPPLPPGRPPSAAHCSGGDLGGAGALKEVITQICRQQALPLPSWDRPDSHANAPWLLLTGGGAPFLEPVFPHVRQVPSLALHGLVIVARNHHAAAKVTNLP
jgi:type III pantothenate kinase